MKKYIPTILAGAACVLLGISLVQNYEMKQQMQNMETNLYNRIGYLENSVNSVYSNIDSKLEEEANLLMDSRWSFEDADMDAGTVMAVLEVIPKEYRPGETNAVIVCNDQEYPMILENGMFRAEVEISLFEESYVKSVWFEEAGAIRTESLNWGLTPRYDYLPVVYAHYAGGATGMPKEGIYTVTFDGEIKVNVNQKADLKPIQSICMVEMIDDEEIGRTQILLEEMSDESLTENEEIAPAVPIVRSDSSVNGLPSSFVYELDQKKVSFPYGSTYAIYVEVEDGYGLFHRAWAWREKVNENGEPEDDDHWWWRGAEASIYNLDGEALSTHDDEFY